MLIQSIQRGNAINGIPNWDLQVMTSKSGVVLLNVMGFFFRLCVMFLFVIANLFRLNDFSWFVEMKQIYLGFFINWK